MFKKLFIILFASALLHAVSLSQEVPSDWFKEYKTVVPGKQYEAGWFHEVFFGAHWRDVWTTPVKVGVIDISKYGGGLTPTEKGGGFQTKGLKFKGGDGKEYKFRSLDKDPQKTLPVELQESIAKDIVQDQISSSNPYAGFVVNPVLDAVGVYHTQYTLVIIPDDAQLSEFRNEFKNQLGVMEIVPEAEQFEGSDKVIGTVKLLDRLNKEFDESVDADDYLKARLMDIFFGDWDRHKDQWKWIRFEEGNKKIYKPYPMDRDQAFAEFDGLLPFIAAQNIPQLNHFGNDYPDMRFMTWSGRYLDQRFLTFLDKESWDIVTNEVYGKLTNEVIESAVKKLPPEIYYIAKDEIIEKLKSRRSGFKEASDEYYELVNSVVDIYTTDKDDFITLGFNPITGIDLPKDVKEKGYTMITIFEKDIDAGEKKSDVLRQRIFDNSITEEIRIYLQEGDDEINIWGSGVSAPKIRIIGSDGKDIIKNTSDEAVYFYDDGKKSKTKGDVSKDNDKYETGYEKLQKQLKKIKSNISKEKKKEYEEKIANLRYDPVIPPDKFHMTTFFPVLSYSPDAGPLFGGSYNYIKYGFRMNPYLYKLQFMLGYAPDKNGLKGLVADFNSDFRGIIKRSGINLHLRKSGIEINNFFGLGNNLNFDDSLSKADYYKIENETYLWELGITYPVRNKLKFYLGLQLIHFRIEEQQNSIADDILFTKEGNKKLNLAYVKAGIEFDNRDHPTAPFKGYYFNISGNYSPKVFNEVYNFGRITGDLRGYIGYKTAISLALRAWGEKVIGDHYPFFEAAFLGGSNTLRGYSSERFAGDGSIMGSVELRLKLFSYNFLLPQTIGVFGFGETGRVYLKNEESKKWHASYGGGLFMHLINRDITFKFTYAASEENDFLFYFSTGFGF